MKFADSIGIDPVTEGTFHSTEHSTLVAPLTPTVHFQSHTHVVSICNALFPPLITSKTLGEGGTMEGVKALITLHLQG